MHNLGHTRSANRRDHLLHTPDTFVRTVLPGMQRGSAVVHISPAAGAAFTQYTAELEPGGSLGPPPASASFTCSAEGEGGLRQEVHSLSPGGYAYIPARLRPYRRSGRNHSPGGHRKKLHVPTGSVPPSFLIGQEEKGSSSSYGRCSDLQVRTLLPEEAGFDFAVNTMTYQPGASLSMVEIHVMEHGLLMLEGGGIYRLGDAWYPVTAGDFIWMAPFCPQWFGAIGKQPAKYLIYKDWNRHPLR